ncbi:CHAP protein, partial [human gut metagenome]
KTAYDIIEEGLHAGAKNLYEGYIKKGLDTPKKIGPKYAPVGASNDPDNLNANWVPNNEKVMKDLGAEDIKSSSKSKDKDKEDEGDDEGASSADTSNDSVPKNPCGDQDKSSDDSGGGKSSGEIGSSVKA